MSDKKTINEMNSAAGGGIVGGGGPFVRKPIKRKSRNVTAPFVTNEADIKGKISGSAAVYDSKKGSKHKKTGFKLAKVAETKSESILREAIRNLIFLSRIKYHEENVKREIQEQKLRKVIRYLLKEEKGAVMLTTGENNAADFINNVRSTTFDQLYAKLSSVKDQRDAFVATYKEKLELYLDSLDKQHVILNPDDKPQGGTSGAGGVSTVPPELAAGQQTTAQPPLAEAAAQSVAMPQGATNVVPDTSRLQTQVMTAQLNKSGLHPTGVQAALKALEKDLPQIDSFYSPLTFKPLQLPSGEVISDREAFRRMLFGFDSSGSKVDGNIDIEFNRVNQNVATSDTPAATPAAQPDIPVPTGTTPGEPAKLATQPGEEGGLEEPLPTPAV